MWHTTIRIIKTNLFILNKFKSLDISNKRYDCTPMVEEKTSCNFISFFYLKQIPGPCLV